MLVSMSVDAKKRIVVMAMAVAVIMAVIIITGLGKILVVIHAM